MRVIHVLKDGSQVDDISGRVVKIEDAGTLYSMIRDINRKAESKKIREASGQSTGSK